VLKSLDDLEFIFPWRSYQAELLKHFSSHIADNHFHVYNALKEVTKEVMIWK